MCPTNNRNVYKKSPKIEIQSVGGNVGGQMTITKKVSHLGLGEVEVDLIIRH